jgi:hypothetical protein
MLLENPFPVGPAIHGTDANTKVHKLIAFYGS